MIAARLYILQRFSAMAMGPLVLAHLVVILIAVRGGLTAEEILARTQGAIGWMLFYGAFVLLAAVHGAIGLRAILVEWTGLHPRLVDGLVAGWLLAALILGLRAVAAVTG